MRYKGLIRMRLIAVSLPLETKGGLEEEERERKGRNESYFKRLFPQTRRKNLDGI